MGRGRQSYIPDIVVYKDSKPYIIIELKSRYINKEFERINSKVSEYAKNFNAPYFAIASLEFIDAFKFENNKIISIDDIPSKNNLHLKHHFKKLEDLAIIHLFGQIKDILKGGGKRDDYSVISEINKLLLIKYFLEKEENSLNNESMLSPDYNTLLKEANDKYHILDEEESIDLNKEEFTKVLKILKNINLADYENIDYIYIESLVKVLKDEVLCSDKLLDLFKRLKIHNSSLLIANSGFGQLSLSFGSSELYYIDNNKVKFETNKLLQLLKNKMNSSYLGDFLNKSILSNESYTNIIALPILRGKTDIYEDYIIDYKKKYKQYSILYIERSLNILNENGYLYIILPNSILSHQSYSDARLFIKSNFKIISIISLPIESLLNTNVSCSLLVLQKTISIHDYDILFSAFNEETDVLVNNHIRGDTPIYSINSEVLYDRWDYHYYKLEFLDIEKKIKNLPYLSLKEKVKIIRGSSLGHDKNGSVPLITVSSIENGEIKENKLSLVTEDQSYENKRGIVHENDLVITVVGKYSRCAKVTREFEGSNTNSGIVILRSDNFEDIEYIYEYLNSPLGQMLLHRGITYTSTVAILTQTEIEKIPLVLDYKYKDVLEETDYIDILPLFDNKKNDKNKIPIDECDKRIVKELDEQQSKFERQLQVRLNEEKNRFLNEFELNSESLISLYGIKGEIFGVKVIRSFISIEDLRKFKTDKQDFQRDINNNHKKDLIKYITTEKYKFFPEIVLGINNYFSENNDKVIKEKNLMEEELIYGNKHLVKLTFHESEIFDKIEVLDGRHRIESLKLSENIELSSMVSVVFILFDTTQSKELLDKVIFYNLNKKARQLDPIDYLQLLKSDDKKDKLKELEILNVDLYKYLSARKDEIYKSSNEYEILEECIILTEYMEKIYDKDKEYLKVDKNKLIYFKYFKYIYKYLLKEYSYRPKLVNKFYKLIVYITYNDQSKVRRVKYLIKEITGFIEWLKLSKLMENVKEIENLEAFYNTYQKTNIPKSRKIYLSIPYHKETEWTYFVIKDVINEISNNLQVKIDLIRTDQQTYGVHTGISEIVYNEIESCDLMIADLTGDNINVFNEIGFKMGIDKAQKVKETQIIFVVNSKSYYEEELENESFIDDEYKVKGKILKNKSKPVPFNLRGIKHIEFHTSHYLKAELYKELEQYFNYYKISKIAK